MTLRGYHWGRQVVSGVIASGTTATGGDGTTPGGNTNALRLFLNSGATPDGTIVYGADGLIFTPSSSSFNGCYARLPLAADSASLAARVRFQDRSATGAAWVMNFQNTAGVDVFRVVKQTSQNRLLFQNGSGTFVPTGNPFGTPGNMVPGDYYELSVEVTVNTTTAANGTVTADRYHKTAGTVDSGTWSHEGTQYVATSSWDLGTALLRYVEVGPQIGGTNGEGWVICDVQFNDGSTTEIASYVPSANVAPVITISTASTSTAPGAPIAVAASATDTDGTITALSASLVTVPPAALGSPPSVTGTPASLGSATATLTATFTPTIAGPYTIRFSSTDSGGAAATPVDRVFWCYSSSGTDVRPTGGSVSDWDIVNAASLVEALADQTDTSKYLRSPANPAGTTSPVVILGPLGSGGITVWITGSYEVGAVFLTPQLRKNDATTVVKNVTQYALTSTPTEVPFSLTSGELATIPNPEDRTALNLLFPASV